ncbi:beta-glucosidase BglX [Saccharophagus degradans]|uniref:beta-glucosidase BglX n=1 Tax=Saccharophagus degradans TaxID=86304 RepID=UPI001C09DF59|nr:beta-glucosidase BglX [Saccharophagus degradans]MBU2985111.1 beta-glucosidase BglX [Saccharophagus degradans]
MNNTIKNRWRISRTIAAITIAICGISSAANAEQLSDAQIEQKIDQLLNKMTLTEKIGQLQLRDWGMYGADKTDQLKQDIREGKIGGFLNVNFDAVAGNTIDDLQRVAVEESPNGIPLINGQDVIHGYKTIFPIPLGQAASWNPSIVKQGARIAAEEATSEGIRWTFAPMIDISRNPRWGRIAESLGEDPYLTSVLGVAMVEGFQTDDPTRRDAMAASAKHFIGYGAAEAGRDYNAAYIPETTLRDIYLPPFKAAVDANLLTIMSSYNTLNDIPATANKKMLKDVLRGEWKFNGFVVSDWNAVLEMLPHGFAKDAKHAAELTANGGVDFEMHTTTFEEHLPQIIKEGKFTLAELDQAVRNMLRVKYKLGLHTNPYTREGRENIILSESNLVAARQAARESFVLLKNDNSALPLKKNQTVALIGPLANVPHEQLGTWIYNGDKKDSHPFLPAIEATLKDAGKVIYVPTLKNSRDTDTSNFKAAIKAAKKADVILFIGGEESILTGEGHSRGRIDLPGAQHALVDALAKTNKPLVTVIMAGRPLALGNVLEHSDAIMMAWHPGTMAGPALADVLFGDYGPQGKLPLTWPVDVGQTPIYYNRMATGRPATDDNYTRMEDIEQGVFQHVPGNSSNHLDLGHLPQYPFGFGLTYSSFEYSDIKLSTNKIALGSTLTATATITNTGKVTATETVQLYVQDIVGSVTRPIRELKGFKKVSLKPGESKTVSFTLHTDALAFHNPDMQLVTEPGDFNLWIAAHAQTGLAAKFEVTEK